MNQPKWKFTNECSIGSKLQRSRSNLERERGEEEEEEEEELHILRTWNMELYNWNMELEPKPLRYLERRNRETK